MLKRLLGRKKNAMSYRDSDDPVSEFPQLDGFWQTTEVSNGRFFINTLFQRKFHSDAPAFGHHWVSFYQADDGSCWPVSYIHARVYGPMILIGGVMTDGAAMARMKEAHRQSIIDAGGCYYTALRQVFVNMADQCEAYMGLIADPRSMEVSCAAGFEKTRDEKLVAYFHQPATPQRREELIQAALNIGPF
jgi:hypothetical protein